MIECSATKGSEAPSELTAITRNVYSFSGTKFSISNFNSLDVPAGIHRPRYKKQLINLHTFILINKNYFFKYYQYLHPFFLLHNDQ